MTTNQAERFTITNLYRRAAELGTRLTEQIDRTLGPKIARRLANGEHGRVRRYAHAAARDGLRENGRVLAWADYRRLPDRRAQADAAGRSGAVWYALPLSEVDNITLLLEVLREQRTQDQNV